MKEKEDASEITEKVNHMESEFGVTYQRMDDDFEMWSMKTTSYPTVDYGVTSKDLTRMHDSDIDVVSNDVRTFSDQVQSTLSDAEMQIIIRMAETEGEDKREDISKLERLLYFALDMADRRLHKLLMPAFREAIIWFSIVRGWAVARPLVYKQKGGNVIFDLLPMDARWLTYEVGGDSFLWTAYKTLRSGVSLKDEWGYEAKQKSNNEVIDYWRHDGGKKFTNAIICDKTFVKEPKAHQLRSFPVIAVPVATRPPISTPTGSELGGYGDSIFASLRDINKTRNRFASIAATHANLLSKQPIINYYDEQGKQLETTVYLAEGVLNLPKGHNQLDAAPMKELAPTVVQMLNWLNEQVERASLPHIPVGSPPPSGTLYNLVQEAGNKVFNPQLKNLRYFYEEILRQIEEQLIDGNMTVDVKHEEKRKYFEVKVTPVDLKKPHLTRVEFTARTPWTQFDTYQIADMAKRLGLPDAFIHEYILKFPDPKGLGDLSAIEIAEHSPKMAMIRAIRALKKAGRDDEAMEVMGDLYKLVTSEEQATVTEEPRASVTPAQLPPSPGIGGM